MSQVMSSPLLAGGPAVGLASCEEPRSALHPAPSPGLPPQCPYYTTEGWGAQALMAPMPCKEPPSRLQQAPQAGAQAGCLPQSPGEQASGALEDLDSYIDFSLESLNQMILELDPTFQLLPPGPGGPWAEPTQSTTSRRKKEEPEALDIKYIEVTSTRSRCHNGPQSCSSPSVTPPFGSPGHGGLPLSRDIPRETRSNSESLIFSGSQGRGHQRPSPPAVAPSSHPPPSPSISIPGMGNKASGCHGLGSPLVASPALEKGLGGRVSMLSASPASDVSYVFGSQSLFRSSISSHQSSSRSLESPTSSSSSLHSLGPVSLYTRASDLQVPSNPTPSTGQPRATHSSPLAKEHASSCPPSITNSMVDIPIVLINSCPEPGSPPSQRTPGRQDFVCPGATSSSNPCPATRSHSQTLPDAPLTTSPEGPARDMQPTMKFVMDTSKYWFKPSITREQAIELLRKEEPGAFIVRDSSSYRGSFGLALKKSAGCHALYLSSVSVETLSGALAVQKAISTTLERDVLPTPTVVHFKVTKQGITLTDIQRKVFFRRHYPFATLRFCGMDPKQRKWQKYCKPSRIFGFVAKSQTESQENVCHLFAEYDTVQPASQVISLVGALL
ncbi:tensin-4 isoform X2 [Phocoena sinus]|uniref:tensin-4 isoform X2 n=1 Tax=Phocoena sinus TaxID=42100 RepID=UPI0013C4AF1C|nr:tensin-4 isoform X2 [Phocoena sinus]